MRRCSPVVIVFASLFLMHSCGSGFYIPAQNEEAPVETHKIWSLFIYMNGDNDLESQALKDLNEMEAALGRIKGNIEVIVLIDRSDLYDAADGDWTGTRLYRVEGDPDGLNYNLVSRRMSCPGLGIDSEGDTELNLGSPSVLSAFINHSMANYESDRNMLIIWGHGSGWRGGGDYSPSGYKGVSFDDGDNDFLYTSELGEALEGQKLDILGFDTCSSMLIEIACEVSDSASYMAGSQDVISAEGWDYEALIEKLSASDGGISSASDALVSMFKEDYQSASGATFSVVDLSMIEPLLGELDNFVARREVEASLSGDPVAYYSALKTRIIADVEDFYTTPGDLNIDLAHLGQILEGGASPLAQSVSSAVYRSFTSASGNPDAQGLSIHLVPLQQSGIQAVHDDAYFRDRVSGYQLEFVSKSSWCPDGSGASGFLWNLFY